MDDLRKNAEGYADPTAFNGMKPVIKQEADLDGRVAFLIKVLKFIIRSAGFELIGRIVIKDKETGKVFR